MKTYLLLALTVLGPMARPAEFINLNFEGVIQPLPSPDPRDGTIPASLALPGWHVPIIGFSGSDSVLYNNFYLSLTGVSLYSRNFSPNEVIEGDYSVYLRSGLTSPLPTGSEAAIVQSGLIPQEARSLLIKSTGPFIQVFLGGEPVQMIHQAFGPNYSLYAGDISAHAGQERELRLQVPYIGIAPTGQVHTAFIDDIQFSTVPVPEPGIWPVLALGMAGFAFRNLRFKR